MTAHNHPVPDFSATASWPIRLEFYRGSEWQTAALESIAADAKRAGDLEVFYAAQYAIDTGDLVDIDHVFAEAALAEREHESARVYELTTGKEYPSLLSGVAL